MPTVVEDLRYEAPCPTDEALAIHESVMPLAASLGVLNPHESLERDTFYGEGGVRRIALGELDTETVPGAQVFFRDECLQAVRSYKVRGAMAAIGEAKRADPALARVVAFSAGNHAQGVGQAARVHGVAEAVITTFRHISPAKEAQILGAGGTLYKDHSTLEEARDAAMRLAETPHTALIPPFDDEAVMAGQSTMMSESIADLLARHQAGEVDVFSGEIVFTVPGGGGGAAAGMAMMLYELKRQGVVGPGVKLKVVQMEGCDAIAHAARGEAFGTPDASCDGTAVSEPGGKTMAIIRDPAFVDEIVVVPKGYVGRAMQALEAQLGHPVEPAGALSLAGVMYLQDQAPTLGTPPIYVTTVSGGNVSPQTQTHFAQAAFHMQSEQYAVRDVYGADEVLDRHPSRVSPAIGTLVLGGAGR